MLTYIIDTGTRICYHEFCKLAKDYKNCSFFAQQAHNNLQIQGVINITQSIRVRIKGLIFLYMFERNIIVSSRIFSFIDAS